LNRTSNSFVVVPEKHRFGAGIEFAGTWLRVVGRGALIYSRQVELESSSHSRIAVSPDIAVALLDNAVHRRKSQASSLPYRLCGEEWLEDMRQGLWIDS